MKECHFSCEQLGETFRAAPTLPKPNFEMKFEFFFLIKCVLTQLCYYTTLIFFSFFNHRTYSFQEESKIKWSGKEWTFIFLKKGYYFLLINRFKSFHDWYEINLLVGDNWTSLYLRWNPLGNWVVLIFSRQKPCTRIISSILHFFFTLFKGY